jgi:hypothetical protein
MIIFTLIADTTFAIASRAASLAVSWAATFAPRWSITAPLARAVAWRRAIWPTAFESRRRTWRMRRMRQPLLDELGHLVEFFAAQ